MEQLFRDVRYALIVMRRNRGFTAAALATLSLGIGATTAVFSIVYGVLLRPLPYADASRVVTLSEDRPGAASPLTVPMVSNLTYYAWRESPQTLDTMAAYSGRQYTVELPGGSTRIVGATVTPSLFPLLGVTPAVGRFFDDRETAAGADAVMVLSDRLWREQFGADPDILRRSVRVDGKPYAIVGVAPPGFAFPAADTLAWTPYLVAPPSPNTVAGAGGSMQVIRALGRLRPGATTKQAEAEGTAASKRYPRPMADQMLFGAGTTPVVAHVRTMLDDMTSSIRPALLVLAAAVALVLLVACANVANLLLSRGIARQREMTVRAAIGASRGRLTRQLLTESLVLSAAGGVLGALVAWALVGVVRAIASSGFPRLTDISVDRYAIAFAGVAAVVTTILSGLVPAIRQSGFELAESLRGGDGASAAGFRGARGRRLRDLLLAVESAFAVVLLVGAVLLARSFLRLTHVDAGYTAENVVTAQVFVPGYDAAELATPAGAAKAGHIATLLNTSLQRLRATRGITSVGAGNMMPLDNASAIAGFPAPWTPPGSAPTNARALQYLVTPGYAETLGLRLKGGRLFTDADLDAGVRPWIVNEEFARLYLPPNQAVGYRFQQGQPNAPATTVEIVGVVGNVLKNGNDTKPQPEFYRLPRGTGGFSGRFQIAAKTTGPAGAMAPQLRALLRELEPTAAVETVTLESRVEASVEQPRFAMTVLASFAVLALGLAGIGLYGVLSYGVSQRRRELGVRSALGATRGDLIALVVREGLGVTAIGLAAGLVAAGAVTRLMQSLLFGVTPLDVWSFVAAPLILAPIALVACLLPAARAAAMDAADALRTD